MSTNYVDDLFLSVYEEGMTDDLFNLLKDDLNKLNKLGVKSDRERDLLFYLDNFVEDILDEFNIESKSLDEIINFAFNVLRKKEEIDLFDIRLAVLLFFKNDINKIAYPNIKGVEEGNMRPQRDINKWIKTLKIIYTEINNGENRNNSIKKNTEGWDLMEKQDFLYWLKYYENNDHEKYQFKTAESYEIPKLQQEEQGQINPPLKDDFFPSMRGPGRPKKIEKSLDQIKISLINRLDSASKLLREFSNVWPQDIWNRLFETLADLQKEIIPMKTATTINDRIIRTAGIWDKYGFSEGATFLRKIAQPQDDVVNKVEKALTGKEFEEKENKPSIEQNKLELPSELPKNTSISEDVTIPPAGVEEQIPSPPIEQPIEQFEQPINKKNKSNEKEIMTVEEENPFEGKNVQDVINILEPLSKGLSERTFNHELSKADMILDSLNLSSYFPELTEVQNKALELNIYMLSRLKAIINKLKGSLKDENKKEKNEAPSIEMEELMNKKEEGGK